MPRIILLMICTICALLAGAPPAVADANSGEFMGYRLNQRYSMTERTQTGQSLSGNRIIIAESPVMPADMGEVRLTATVDTHTIGFIEASQSFATDAKAREFAKKYYTLLHAKYPAWRIDAGRIQLSETTLMPTALNMDKWPYTLRMKIAETESPDGLPFRVSITLRYLFDSTERKVWNELARFEQGEQQQSSKEELLEEADTRGL